MHNDLTYQCVGQTGPDAEVWGEVMPRFRRYEETFLIGHGHTVWSRASRQILDWGVKTRSGFSVHPASGDVLTVTPGQDFELVASVGPIRVREPVRVVAVVDEADRRGFAYGTLEGHPVSGEEAFVVHRDRNGDVWLTLRSLTRAAPSGPWRAVFPVLLAAQWWYRRRYRRALR